MNSIISNAAARSLPQRIEGLRRELRAAEQKAERVRSAIETRRQALNRLEAALALQGRSGPARTDHECT